MLERISGNQKRFFFTSFFYRQLRQVTLYRQRYRRGIEKLLHVHIPTQKPINIKLLLSTKKNLMLKCEKSSCLMRDKLGN